MKIAGGCFGCLALIFLILALTWTTIYGAIVTAAPDVAMAMSPVAGFVQYINGACCCLSGMVGILLLVAGSMGKKTDEYE